MSGPAVVLQIRAMSFILSLTLAPTSATCSLQLSLWSTSTPKILIEPSGFLPSSPGILGMCLKASALWRGGRKCMTWYL
ncbi:uncharacterized protein FOBCDRAFT_233346 [Fusarium oxysporum Fo47]|uniref:uncharacterized protein n=1 Tax=Fusarium oxysporum Fo47 TaxID=660027 RepID=UPI002869DC25|nr:uncharacterized protein FOBCDRAFT_233346 [Fusarium oxysporum Fo47]WJG37103.1 hypothetical protein FOBCDRAFT_233346 [Fusarium oxysporum Fo47]